MKRGNDDLEKKVEDLEKQVAYLKGLTDASGRVGRLGYEYKSEKKLLGLPLIHVNQGLDPKTGRPGVAIGFIALGNVAIGVFALGGLSFGAFCFGGVALGLLAFGGLSLGLGLAVGGVAVGLVAVGGLAVGYYAAGGLALGTYTVSSRGVDPQAVEFFKRILPAFLTKPGVGP